MGAVTEIVYSVPGVSCGHCRSAIQDEVAQVNGVADVEVDLHAKRVAVRGDRLDDGAIRAAIEAAGYAAAA